MANFEENPHLYDELPGSGDFLFKKWILGIVCAGILALWGAKNILQLDASIPIGKGRSVEAIQGFGAICAGVSKLGLGLFLHARYYLRFHVRMWRCYRPWMIFGLALGVSGWSTATVLVLKRFL